MKRVLMYASVASMIQQFNMENIRLLLEAGYAVDVACNMEQGSSISDEKIATMKQELEQMGVRVFHIPIPRKVTAVSEIMRSIGQSRVLMNENRYDLIHCHSPIGGMICRVAHRLSKGYGKTKMIYTAHGFHFYKGAPKKNWLMYYPVERICSKFTDVLITINDEDYALAQKKMAAGKAVFVPGVGVDVKKFAQCQVDRTAKREEIGVPAGAFLMMSVGELNENKNHEVVVRALAKLNNASIHYAIAGRGALDIVLTQLAEELGVGKQLHLLGYRSDVNMLYKCADVCIFPSIREGQGLAAIEGMAAGLPLVASDNRGTRGILVPEKHAKICACHDVGGFSDAIDTLFREADTRQSMSEENIRKSQEFDISVINRQMKGIYENATT